MNKMLQFSLISLLLLLSGIGSIIGSISIDNTASMILLIVVGSILILSGVYFLIFALAFKVGKNVNAKIVNKVYIPVDNDENVGNSYYRYEYEIVSNGKVKKGKFRIYSLDNDIISTLNVGDEILVKKLLFVTAVDPNLIIKDIRNKNKDNPEYQKMLGEQGGRTRKAFRTDIIVGISIFVLIAICCIIYVINLVK